MVSGHPSRGRLSVGPRRIEHMIETRQRHRRQRSTTTSPPPACLPSLRDRKAAEDRAAADQLDLAARWADLHPPESIHSAAVFTVAGCEHEEPIAGEGCPTVAEFCVAELGAVLGMSTVSAKRLIGHALELRHRLPRLWAQVQSGAVAPWRARTVAEATIHTTPSLTLEAAGWVDAQVAAVAGRIGPAQLDRLVAETIKRFELAGVDPAADPEDGYLSVDPRHATLNSRRRPLRRHPALRGRPRPRRRPRPRPGTGPRRGGPEGPRLHRVVGRTPRQGPRQPRSHPDRPRSPVREAGSGPRQRAASGHPESGPGEPQHRPARRSGGRAPRPLRRHHRRSGRRCSVPPGGSRKANDWCCSTRSRPGAATPGPRSPSSPSSTSPPP